MGTFTDDMASLRSEIGALRTARKTFMDENLRGAIADLRDGVEEMLTGFRKTHAKIARKAETARQGFLSNLRDGVLGLQEQVANFRHDAAAEMRSAHAAFFGSVTERRTKTGRRRKLAASSKRVKGASK